jgi:ATP-dependent 26S proteasome regulatory subunit
VDITREHSARHSETEFVNKFSMYVDSGAGLIHVRAMEPLRAALAVRKAVITDGGIYKEWDIVSGMRDFDQESLYNHAKTGDGNVDVGAAFALPLEELRQNKSSDKVTYYVFMGTHVFMENNPHMAQLIAMYSQMLPASNVSVILITPDQPLPESVGQVMSIRFDPPGLGELRESLTGILDSVKGDFDNGIKIDEEEMDKVCYVGAGMSKQQFEAYASLSVVEAGRAGKKTLKTEDVVAGVNQGKIDVVNSSDILELYPPADIDNIGGMENLKEWIRKRARCYGDDAKEFGVEAPKGMVFVGPPGTGKSLCAKAVSAVLGVPLVRLDFGRVFNSLVGASEQRIRGALRMVESMSPCVLFCDEIDKGLGGIANGASGDSGVSMRVLGSFLTWLQDSKAPVFTMVTANNIDGLPPELMRRGRFDAIFSTNLPTPEERREVLAIHLALRNRNIEDYPKDEVDTVIDASNEYVPAEIESAIKDGLIDAFDASEEFSMSHVHDALVRMVPLSKAFKAQIARMSDWAATNATPASLTADQRAKFVTEKKNRVRVRRRGG